jgi:hypothetical protein
MCPWRGEYVNIYGKKGGQNYIRLEKGSYLQDAEFEQVKEFVLQLPELDRVIVI